MSFWALLTSNYWTRIRARDYDSRPELLYVTHGTQARQDRTVFFTSRSRKVS